jgi:3'5'-cyclic nucleotide phosphodiesterase
MLLYFRTYFSFFLTRSLLYRYNDNPFHNFEHASHVTMSVVKLLSRIVAPTAVLEALEDPYAMEDNYQQMQDKIASTLHDHTYGITSDPLTQFAVVFSALIHDVDHQGIPNTTLVAEKASIASLYRGKSVAEQNSFDLAWNMLMDSAFSDLRKVICETATEAKRFRQLVVNTVLATDIMDKDLKALRNDRWEKAFSSTTISNTRDDVNRKATIVIEHLIQASDVAHTMQHWHVYRKWNERLFAEMYKAYKQGRAATDPAEFWYKGEIGFFDFYIIPLAKKLKECGVFGVSSDEYLDYALTNRKEWEDKGNEVVASVVEKFAKNSVMEDALAV